MEIGEVDLFAFDPGASFVHVVVVAQREANAGRGVAQGLVGRGFAGSAGHELALPAEALGMTVPHAALAPSGGPIWTQMARDSADVAMKLVADKAELANVLIRAYDNYS